MIYRLNQNDLNDCSKSKWRSFLFKKLTGHNVYCLVGRTAVNNLRWCLRFVLTFQIKSMEVLLVSFRETEGDVDTCHCLARTSKWT